MSALETAVFVTAAASVACWAAAEALPSRTLWTTGALFMLAHAVLAFAAFYAWSHVTARDAVARQTAALTGMAFSGGIYVNYLLVSAWLADAAWWWASPRGYAQRPRAVDAGVRGFIFFIMVNGAVVFADGVARLLGAAAVSIVGVAWLRRMRR